MIVGFPGETEADFEETLTLLDEVGFDAVFAFKYSPRPNTPAFSMEDRIPEEEKSRRLAGPAGAAARDSDATQLPEARWGRYVEVMVEGSNEARGQRIGRTSQNKTLNFTAPAGRDARVWAAMFTCT